MDHHDNNDDDENGFSVTDIVTRKMIDAQTHNYWHSLNAPAFYEPLMFLPYECGKLWTKRRQMSGTNRGSWFALKFVTTKRRSQIDVVASASTGIPVARWDALLDEI